VAGVRARARGVVVAGGGAAVSEGSLPRAADPADKRQVFHFITYSH
jgi:hypothetical protein